MQGIDVVMIWQADFYKRPLRSADGEVLWELVICEGNGRVVQIAFCPQSQVNADWVNQQVQAIALNESMPEVVQVFRPQSLSLLDTAFQSLGVPVEPTRRTAALKLVLQQRSQQYRTLPEFTPQPYDPLALDQPPPAPIPESLWGDSWRFAAIAASDLELAFAEKPIPIRHLPESLLPHTLKLPSTLPIPGVIIYGGRQSMRLAQWLQEVQPVALNAISGEPDGLILDAGLVDRWILATFDDADAIAAAQTYRQRQQTSQGLHFLLVQPDDSGVTYSGIWLLQAVA